MTTASVPLPNWISYGLIPLINLLLAWLFCGRGVGGGGVSPVGARKI